MKNFASRKRLPIPRDVRDDSIQSELRSLTQEEPMKETYMMEEVSGRKIYLNFIVRPVIFNNQPMTLMLIKDSTNLYDLKQAKEAERNKDLMMATTSHELRTPLNGIISMMQILEQKIKNTSLKKYIKIASTSAMLMYTLVNDMLDFSAMNAKKFKKKLFNFCPMNVINEAADLLRYNIEKKNLELNVECGSNMVEEINGDKDRLK